MSVWVTEKQRIAIILTYVIISFLNIWRIHQNTLHLYLNWYTFKHKTYGNIGNHKQAIPRQTKRYF